MRNGFLHLVHMVGRKPNFSRRRWRIRRGRAQRINAIGHSAPWRPAMPVITFTVRRGLSASQKPRLSEAMLEAQVAAGFERNDLIHRFLEVDPSDLLVDRLSVPGR